MTDPFEEARGLIPPHVMAALIRRLRDEHTGAGSLHWRRARGEWLEARLEPAPLIRSEDQHPRLTKPAP